MTLGERIRYIRQHEKIDMTLEEFGARICLKKSSLSQVENGSNAATDRVIKLICTEFNVSEEWLRYEKGEPFLISNNDLIEQLAASYKLDAFGKSFIREFLELNDPKKAIIEEFIMKVCAAQKSNSYEIFNNTNPLSIVASPKAEYKTKK